MGRFTCLKLENDKNGFPHVMAIENKPFRVIYWKFSFFSFPNAIGWELKPLLIQSNCDFKSIFNLKLGWEVEIYIILVIRKNNLEKTKKKVSKQGIVSIQ